MRRISTNMPNADLQYSMKRKDYQLSEIQKGISSGRRINNLRDDPMAAAHSGRLQSAMKRINQFQKNIDYTTGRYNQAESYMTDALNIMHRLKEMSVQASNGTYSQDERNYMAVEVNEMLNELVRISNVMGENGVALFGGTDTTGLAFSQSEGRVPGIDGTVVTDVQYNGSIDENKVEIADGNTIKASFTGNNIFWAENQTVFGAVDSTGYVVNRDSTIFIDGKEISLQAGDNVQSIIHKINDSDTSVKASLDPVTNALVMKGTLPHQLFVEEAANSTVLKDLGILSNSGSSAPSNYHRDAVISGGSIFDTAIQLRDNLLSGDYEMIATQSLRSIDSATNHLLTGITDIGTQSRRLDVTSQRISKAGLDYSEIESKLADLDITEAATELKMAEYTQKATYQVAGKILQPTLMDFLR